MSVEIIKIESNSPQASDFYKFPLILYKDDPLYTIPFKNSEQKSVERECFKEHQQIFIAYQNGITVARLIAR